MGNWGPLLNVNYPDPRVVRNQDAKGPVKIAL